MTLTLNEFQFMVCEAKFDIVTFSKTWLKNERRLIEFVNIPFYKVSFRDVKRDGGVDPKDCISCKLRNDIVRESSIKYVRSNIVTPLPHVRA